MKNSNENVKELDSKNKIAIPQLINQSSNSNPQPNFNETPIPDSSRVNGVSYLQVLINSSKNK